MRILVLAPQPYYSERGTPIAILNLVKVLSGMGHEIDLLVYPGGRDVEVANVRVIRTWRVPFIGPVPVGFSPQKIVYDVLMTGVALWKTLRHRYDVIHANEEAVFIGMPLAPLRRSRLVYDMDSSMSDQLVEKWPGLSSIKGFFEWFEGLAVKRSDRVIAVCQALADRATGYTDRVPVDILEDVIMEQEQRSEEQAEDLRQYIPEHAKMMLYVGNLEHYQGVDLVIEGMAHGEMPDNLYFLVIGGGEEDIERCQMLAQRLGIADKVKFLGPKPVLLLMDYLRQADILVSPRTKGINTPMKIYSYLGAGVPIVATNISSHTQVLHDGNSFLTEPTPEAITAGINRLLADDDFSRTIGENALHEASTRFSFAAFRDKLENIYRQLA